MDTDISKVLAYEIKKELADRYFGFRKLIEQEKDDLNNQVKHFSASVEQKIAHDLIRIYIMLKDEELIARFFSLSGLNEEIFYDPYAISSPTIIKRVFAEFKPKGLTRAGRFKNLLLSCYDNLCRHIEKYREKMAELFDDQETITEEINLFYKKNDLTHIMGFLRSLDTSTHLGSDLHSASTGLVSSDRFEKKMRVLPPNSVDEVLAIIPPITPFALIKKELKKLANKAYKLNQNNLPYER
jgi:hypothetical protein